MARTLIAVAVALASLSVVAQVSPAHARQNFADAWGFNNDGELGNATTESSDVPVAVTRLHGVRALAGGMHHSLALLEDGTVAAWGDNRQGQLGDGTTESSRVPVDVPGLTEVAAIAAAGSFSLALLKNGTVMAWGKNSSGQLGNGTTTGSDVPVPVSGLTETVAIAAGDSFGLALLKDGGVRAWGEDDYGQLGDGGREGSDVPVTVTGLGAVIAIAAGSWHSLALLADGTVMAWGQNEGGQLGDSSEADSDIPVAVTDLTGVSAIAAGRRHSLALLGTGAAVAWGSNVEGQLGNGSHTGPEQCGVPRVFACSKTPVLASGLSDVTAVSARGDHSMALLSNRTIMAWGQNDSGQLGNGTTGPEACGTGSCSAIPVAVCPEGPQLPCPTGPAMSNVRSIAAGEAHSMAIVEPPSPLPQLGRCVRIPGGGAYRGRTPRCLALSSTHTGNFEWLPGPGPNAQFIDQIGESRLETAAGRKLSCLWATLEGEYTGPKSATVAHLTLGGCRDGTTNSSCQTNPLQEGLVDSSQPLDGALGFITSGSRPRVGWDLEPRAPSTSLVSFECGSGSSTVAVALKGSVIGRVTPTNQMVSAFELHYTQSGGLQIPQRFEVGLKELLTLTTTSPIGVQTSEQVGLTSKGLRGAEEALEIKAKG